MAASPNGSRLYVAEAGNNRISEFGAWGQFVEAWGWGVKDGVGQLETCGPAEPQIEPPASLCRAGSKGSGAGQFDDPLGLAVGPAGDVYVFDAHNLRVQKFSPSGEFLLAFGGEVDKTTGEDVCTAASGDVCGKGVEGAAAGQFSIIDGRDYITIGPDGTVYVGDNGRIQEFEADGTFKRQIPLPAAGSPGSLAFDPASGDLYLAFASELIPNPPIYKLNPLTGAEVGAPLELISARPGEITALEVGEAGGLYAAFDPIPFGTPESEPRVVEFGAGGEILIGAEAGFGEPAVIPEPNASTEIFGMAANGAGDLYVSAHQLDLRGYFTGYGPPPIAIEPPPKVPPVISEQFAASVDANGAVVKAKINPRFWADTTYYVEYGTTSCASSSCTIQPTPPGSRLTSQVVNAPLLSGGVFLGGLQPNTTYHYRFVAESGGGGPVRGLSGKSGEEAEGVFTTMPTQAPQPPCPENQAFRPGSGAFLADCRAYEMVSPVDKNGADISVVLNSIGDPAGLDQGSPDGERLTYSAYRAFGEVESSPYTSQYLATRTEGVGWSSRGISPPRQGASLYQTIQLDSQYKGFSADLCHGWLLQDTANSLAEGSLAGWPNLYRRDLCAGGYAALGPEVAPTVQVDSFRPEVEGFSADGATAIFVARGKLTANASEASQLYEASEGSPLRLVCILPNGTAASGSCTAGNVTSAHSDRAAAVTHAISEDGSRIYWTESQEGAGKLYVRVNGTQTTLLSGGSATFLAAAEDGGKALYAVGGELFEFNLASKSSKLIAKGFKGLLGASEDASKAYFLSSEALAGAGQNQRGQEAAPGQPNLYLREVGAPAVLHFIATLSASDVGGELSPAALAPFQHLARVSPDGGALAFASRGRPTGFDNTDAQSGQADAEVYVFRAGPETLACVSCLRTGARPLGRAIKGSFWAAARIPTAENQLHYAHVLADNGKRLFFESFDALSPRDTNSQQDVYEWEASGEGNCGESAPGFDVGVGGCVNLISSGESPLASELVDASADGRDIFFKTASSLLPQDPGLVDIYDARAGGGFPVQEPPAPECQGESCQGSSQAPTDPTPASQSFHGPEGPTSNKPLKCPKGAHKAKRHGKERCVKTKKKSSKHKARRASR
jgi:hypothetical protein